MNSHKYLICAHQTQLRTVTLNNKINIANFDNLDLRNFYVEIDSLRYLRDSVPINYEENDYIQQYKDLNIIFREYIGEPKLKLLLSYPDMKTKHPIEVIDVRHQNDHITPEKIQLFQEYGTDPDNARLFCILIRRKKIELIGDLNNLIEGKII